jgi:hypothetical protein
VLAYKRTLYSRYESRMASVLRNNRALESSRNRPLEVLLTYYLVTT